MNLLKDVTAILRNRTALFIIFVLGCVMAIFLSVSFAVALALLYLFFG